MKYLKLSCKTISFESLKINTAKNIYYTMFANSKANIIPVSQTVDSRNKCKYLITNTGFMIPVKPSGILAHLPIVKKYELKSAKETIDFIDSISTIINVKCSGFIYTNISSNKYTIDSILIENQINVPIIQQVMTKDDMMKLIPNYILDSRSLYDVVDEEIKEEEKILNERQKELEDLEKEE